MVWITGVGWRSIKELCLGFRYGQIQGGTSRPYEEATRTLPSSRSVDEHPAHHDLDPYPTHAVAMAQRVTLRKRQPYNTSSSRRRIVKTPGGVLRYHHIKKLPTAPKCGDCGAKLSGVRDFPLCLASKYNAAHLVR